MPTEALPRLFGISPRKGKSTTSDADLVFWERNAAQLISASMDHMRVDYSLFKVSMSAATLARFFAAAK